MWLLIGQALAADATSATSATSASASPPAAPANADRPPAADPSDLSVTSLGADVVRAETIDQQDANVLLGQRLRWEVARGTRVLIDGRFSLDPDAAITFEDSRLRELGLAYASQGATVLLGRHAVVNGGPRLVDGVQALANVGPQGALSLGAWGGLVPDEFTTEITGRIGGGPILAYTRAAGSVSATGDLVASGGGLERVGALVMARGELGSKFQADSRADVVFTDAAGNSGLADGSLFLRYRPQKTLKLDGFYNAYSSLRYQTRSGQDPTVQRFATRIEELGLTEGITQDLVDPTLHHLVGATFSVVPLRGGALGAAGPVQPIVTLRGRTLLSTLEEERYTRIGALGGLTGLAGERLELDLDGNLLVVEDGVGGDLGLMALVEPTPDAALAIDGSFRMLLDPSGQNTGPSWYADLFLDVVSRGGTSVAAGGSWTTEPVDLVGQDVGLAGFLRVQQWIRPNRPGPGAPGRTAERSDDRATEEGAETVDDSTADSGGST